MERTIFRKAGPLVDYSKYSFPNEYGLTKITIDKKVHTYCRLGGDVYTNQIKAYFNPGDMVCDYVYLDKAIEERFEQSDSIIEEVLAGIVEIIKNQCPNATNIHVESYIDDSVPKNMPVKVEIDA
jgi:hypothetical protein